MSESENQATNWTMGLIGSILLHVAVVGLFVMLGSPSAAPTESDDDPPVAPSVADTPSAVDAPAAVRPPQTTEPVRRSTTEPVRQTSTPVRPRVEPVTPIAAASSGAEPKYYVVQKGDNASKIARTHNLTLPELAKLNGTTVQKLGGIAIGQKLKVAE